MTGDTSGYAGGFVTWGMQYSRIAPEIVRKPQGCQLLRRGWSLVVGGVL